MSIHIDGQGIGSIFVGSQPVAEVYRGADLVWSAQSWDFFDDFERSTIGSAWQGSGGLIAGTAPNRHLKKNTSAGGATYWTAHEFDGDDMVVEALLGPVQDAQQRASILLGGPNSHVYVEFSRTGNNMIGDYNGSTWTSRADLPAQSWGEGDVIRVERVGGNVSVYRNGTRLVGAITQEGRGAGRRRLGLSVHMALNFFVRWYGPTFDEVRVRTT